MGVLSDSRVGAAVAVSDLERARKFYEETLGLSGRDTPDGGVTFTCAGDTEIHIFVSAGAGSSGSTIAGFTVEDTEAAVEELSARGVTFEQYDDPVKTDERGIFVIGDEKAAWFKDPDGNILALFDG